MQRDADDMFIVEENVAVFTKYCLTMIVKVKRQLLTECSKNDKKIIECCRITLCAADEKI